MKSTSMTLVKARQCNVKLFCIYAKFSTCVERIWKHSGLFTIKE